MIKTQPLILNVKSDTVKKAYEVLSEKDQNFWVELFSADNNLEFLNELIVIMRRSEQLKSKDFAEGFIKGAVLVYTAIRAKIEQAFLEKHPEFCNPKAKA